MLHLHEFRLDKPSTAVSPEEFQKIPPACEDTVNELNLGPPSTRHMHRWRNGGKIRPHRPANGFVWCRSVMATIL